MQLNLSESNLKIINPAYSKLNAYFNNSNIKYADIDAHADEIINLKYISNDDLLFRTENLVQTERKIMHLVLTHILEIMNRRLYAELGFDSMYTMMIKKYGYSETSALRRIDAAKLLRSVPEVADRLKSGALNLSQAVQLQKCLDFEAKKGEVVSETRTYEILESLKNCNSFETRQVLAQEFDMPIKIQEIVRPQKDESVRLEIIFTKEQFEELKQAKSFLSHISHTGSWAEVISVLASKHNQSKMGKQNKSVSKSTSNSNSNQTVASFDTKSNINSSTKQGSSLNDGSTSATEVEISKSLENSMKTASSKRTSISVHLKRSVFAHAKGCCQYLSPDGIQCGSQFQAQVDHITPVAWKGSNRIDNLRLLCRTHNLLMARTMGLH